jgi:DNA-binding Lrp family transcriptional regulator
MSSLPQTTAARRAQSSQRRAQALDLVMGGATYAQAGHALGISAQAVHQHVQKALDEGIRQRIKDGAEKLRQMHHQRYEGIILALWPKRTDPKHSLVVLKALEQQARLNGLVKDEVVVRDADGPSKVQVFDTTHLTVEEKLALRDLLMRASTAPATVDVDALPVAGSSSGANGKANGNGTHALELPVGAGEAP